MKSTKRTFAVLTPFLLLLAAHPACAGTTPWADNEGGRMRVTYGAPDANGAVQALLEIEPKPGWITYWREPGEAGIPPTITVTGGKLELVRYPVPKVLKLGALTEIGYDAPVALPLALADISGEAKLDAFIGVCNEICIPFQASFSLPTSSAPASDEQARLDAAQSALPGAPDDGFSIRAARIADNTMTLDLAVPDAGLETEAILTGPEGYVFTARGTGTSLAVPLPGLAAGTDPATYGWRAVLKNGSRAIETKIDLH